MMCWSFALLKGWEGPCALTLTLSWWFVRHQSCWRPWTPRSAGCTDTELMRFKMSALHESYKLLCLTEDIDIEHSSPRLHGAIPECLWGAKTRIVNADINLELFFLSLEMSGAFSSHLSKFRMGCDPGEHWPDVGFIGEVTLARVKLIKEISDVMLLKTLLFYSTFPAWPLRAVERVVSLSSRLAQPTTFMPCFTKS